jgi:hypothetical protein
MTATFFDGVTITVEAALSASTGTYGAWDSGLWDTATWGPDVLWTDITAYVRTIKADRAFSRGVQAWSAGTAQLVLDNRDGRFSPDNLSGPYVTAGVTQVRPWRPVRIRATYSGTTYYLYTGYALDWVESWAGPARTGKGDAICTVPCTDELGHLAGFDGLAQTPAGAGETSGARIHRVLNNAGHTGTRSIDVGRTTVQDTTLAANTVTELKLVADSEGGALWIDADGTVVFEDQYSLLEDTDSNAVQATFGDGGGSELPYANARPGYAADLVKNIASYARVGGTAQTAADATSRALYGDLRDTRTDLVCETDAQCLALATFFIEQRKQPEKRIEQIVVKPRRLPASLFPQVLARKPRDLIRVVRRPPGGHTMTRDCHIAGIHHSIDKSKGDWTTTYDLWSATVFQQYGSSRFDVAQWDTAAWFF